MELKRFTWDRRTIRTDRRWNRREGVGMGYQKNKHCNLCKHAYVDSETVYNPVHFGDPGSTDYDIESRWCCAACGEDHQNCKELAAVRYNCKAFQAKGEAQP